MDATTTLDLDALADRIASMAASLDAATHGLLTDVREFDLREGWAKHGLESCADWLSWKCGIEPGTAREKVRVARALAGLPLIDDQLRRGQLSYSKVRAITRIATADNEASLVELGRASTAAQLAKVCRIVEELRPRDGAEIEEKRWLRRRAAADGMVRIEVSLLPDEAARVIAACDVFAKSARERADALLTMAEATLRGDKPDRSPVEVLLHVDAATLHGNTGEVGVSAEASRRLLCDAGVVPVLENDNGEVLGVGRKLRLFSGALKRALLARDGKCCRFPGCTHARYLHAHHVVHWTDGGETSLENGCLLCARHHRLVHEGGFKMRTDGGSLVFLRPDGRPVGDEPPPTPRVLAAVAALPPTWDGDRIDYDAVVEHVMA